MTQLKTTKAIEEVTKAIEEVTAKNIENKRGYGYPRSKKSDIYTISDVESEIEEISPHPTVEETDHNNETYVDSETYLDFLSMKRDCSMLRKEIAMYKAKLNHSKAFFFNKDNGAMSKLYIYKIQTLSAEYAALVQSTHKKAQLLTALYAK